MSQNAYYQNKLKNMMACEIIFLTHHEKLHESNLRWNPEAEELMWNPDMQELIKELRKTLGNSEKFRKKVF